MSKVLEATCLAGVVKVGSLPIPGATVFSEGVASSQGLLLMEGEEKHYIAKTSPDLKTTLEQLITALEKISTALTQAGTGLTQASTGFTAIAAVAGPAWTPPPTLAANVVAITAAVSQITAQTVLIDAAKTAVDTLKGSLK